MLYRCKGASERTHSLCTHVYNTDMTLYVLYGVFYPMKEYVVNWQATIYLVEGARGFKLYLSEIITIIMKMLGNKINVGIRLS